MKNFIDFTAQHFDLNGNPLSFGRVWCYEAGTLNPKALYLDKERTDENANPVLLSADGRPDYQLFMAVGAYKFVYERAILDALGTPTGTFAEYKTLDNIDGDGDIPLLGVNNFTAIDKCVDLRFLNGNTSPYNLVKCLSYDGTAGSQLGGGWFKWSSDSTATDDGGSVFNFNNNSVGRWIRLFDSVDVYPQMWGAMPNQTALATASAFELLIEWLKLETTQGARLVLTAGNYFTNGSVLFDGDIEVEVEAGVSFSSTISSTITFANAVVTIHQKTALLIGNNIELVVTPQKAIDVHPDWWLTDSNNDSYTLYRAWLGTTRATTKNTIISRAYTITNAQTHCDIGVFNAKFVGTSAINLQTTNVTCSFFGTFENSSTTTPLVIATSVANAGLFYTDALSIATDLSWFGTSLNSSQFNSVIRAITSNGNKVGELEIATPITFVAGGSTSIKVINPTWTFTTTFLKNGLATINDSNIHLGDIDSSTLCLSGTNVALCDNSRVDANWLCITGRQVSAVMTLNATRLNYACLMAVTNSKPLTSNDCVIYVNSAVSLSFTPVFEDFRVLGSGIVGDYTITFTQATDFTLTMKRCEIYQGLNTLNAHCTNFFADSCIFKSASSTQALFVFTGELQINNSVVDSLAGTCILSAGNFSSAYAVSSVRASRFLCPALSSQFIAFKSCEFKGVGYGSIYALGGAMLDCSYFNIATTMDTDGDLRGVYMYNDNKLMSSRVYCVNPNNCTINDNQMLGADGNTNITIKGSVANSVITGLMCTGNNLVPNTLQPIIYEDLAVSGHSKNYVANNNVPFTDVFYTNNIIPATSYASKIRIDGTELLVLKGALTADQRALVQIPLMSASNIVGGVNLGYAVDNTGDYVNLTFAPITRALGAGQAPVVTYINSPASTSPIIDRIVLKAE